MDKWFPSNIKWRLLRILGDLFPVLDDLVDREPRLVERMDAPLWRGYQWPHRDFMLTLRGAPDTRKIPANCTGDEPWLPGVQHVACSPAKAGQCFADGWDVDPSWSWWAGEDDFFPLCAGKIRTPANVVDPENVPDLMFVEPEELEEEEAEEDLRAVICSPCTTCPKVELIGAPENAPGDGEESPLHG